MKEIKQIEKEENIKVLFLIESGSRAWNWESEDSDYDLRGVYIQDYLKFTEQKSQISKVIKEKDIILWDLKKFLTLLIKSNPSVWEWLSSDIIYLDNPIRQELKNIFIKNFSKYALKKHYTSMAQQNFNKYINGVSDTANLKKYLYVLRSVACVLWIEKYNNPPPKNYKKVINLLPKNIQEFFEKIIIDKLKSEKLEGKRNKEVENYVISFFDKQYIKDKSTFNLDELNNLFKNTLKELKGGKNYGIYKIAE